MNDKDGKKNTPVWFVIGFITGVLVSILSEPSTAKATSENVRTRGERLRMFIIYTVERVAKRLAEASQEGRKVATKERQNIWIDDWDLNNPDL